MKTARQFVLAAWVVVLIGCGFWLHRNLSIVADLTVFLPPSATALQRLLLNQLREGVASRLILISLEGASDQVLARASIALAARLKADKRFAAINNGDLSGMTKEREFLFTHRYLLSPAVSPERFSVDGLRGALREDLELLSSPAGLLIRPTLAADPTGEMREIARLMIPEGGPAMRHGVWFSRDGARALLIAETRAPGFDVEAQRSAIRVIEEAFSAVRPKDARIELAGPAVFASQARATIEEEAVRLSALAVVLVIMILFAAYRAVTPVVASLLPVATGLTVGVTAVSAGFGDVHGITLAFGATLIGVAVDYPTYLFTQAADGERLEDTLARIGPTLNLAVLTTLFGALAMVLSSFTGLAQLGVLTIAGAMAAGLTARFVLPSIFPSGLPLSKTRAAPWDFSGLAPYRRLAAWIAGACLAASVAVITSKHERLWDDDLANLSPVPEAAKAKDRSLREELGAPDVRYLLVAHGPDRESALQASESAARLLRESVAKHWLAGFDVPSRYLPSRKTQVARREALPDAQLLARNLEAATRDLPFRDGLFSPFLADVERARSAPLLDLEAFRESPLSQKVESLLLHSADGWVALAPVRGVRDARALATAATRAGHQLLDLKAESNRLVSSYRAESLRLIALGLLCIGALLVLTLRSVSRALRVLAPPLAAVVLNVAILLLFGMALSLFNLVALLLVVGLGLNYSLFFERPQGEAGERARTQLSLVVCGATTFAAFGCLSLSRTPVLHAIGVTVALGSVLSLLLAVVLSRRQATQV